MLIIGSALAVSPFNKIPEMISNEIPKALFNMTNIKDTSGYDFTKAEENKIFV